ncbi:hypothetical protein TRVL_07439 [Trypanosoma vivax]|nr:hypothetical protein TRVL_07439 [Trypanosoma vivax]
MYIWANACACWRVVSGWPFTTSTGDVSGRGAYIDFTRFQLAESVTDSFATFSFHQTKRRVTKHLPPPANQHIPLPFVLALLNHLVQLRQLRRPQRRCHTLALGNRPLCGHSDASRHRLVQGNRALGRPLHPSEYKLVAQFSKLIPPRLVPRVQCTGGFGGSNCVQAGAHEHIERDPIVITVRVQCGLSVRDLAVSAQRDVR